MQICDLLGKKNAKFSVVHSFSHEKKPLRIKELVYKDSCDCCDNDRLKAKRPVGLKNNKMTITTDGIKWTDGKSLIIIFLKEMLNSFKSQSDFNYGRIKNSNLHEF